MLRLEDVSVFVKREMYYSICPQLKAEPSYVFSLNSEEKRLLSIVLGDNWEKLIQTLSTDELAERFYLAYPETDCLRVLGRKMF